MDRWIGKIAVVTGASSGIGAAIAKQLVKNGMIVVGMARREEKIKDIAETLAEKGKLYAVKADVSQEKDVVEAFQWVKNNLKTVNVLINCAGIGRYYPLTGEGKAEHLQQLLNVNALGLTNCTTQALKLMKETGVDDGHIIHLNSVVGHNILTFTGHYIHTAIKHGVTVLTEGLRRELVLEKSKIKVTSISPGLVNTEMVDDFKTPGMEDSLDGMPMLEPKDIADGVIYVLGTPPHVQIQELTIRPVGEQF
ncbi:farnesol dehydrogenase-like [Ischnura elegans]|uniref:farnesol dehydrogenase-like n=1 Tax=Ischnura elegans TaxID=197161 RepID=UPI001ED89814|nr:farnesol dehydrogenase-like [Ischnura elegans]XP_046395243.1 farnesol dehydrogenase-like [Ischnura elegans]